MKSSAAARRAVLRREDCPDIRFELHRASAFDFTIVENGKSVGVFWRTISPQQAMRGDGPSLSLSDAWDSCLAKRYPGYTATDLEEM